MPAAGLSSLAERWLSIGSASCFRLGPQIRSHTLRALHGTAQPVPRMPAWLPSAGRPAAPRGVSSASYSPTATDARRNTHRVDGPVRPQPATAIPAASHAQAGCSETAPTGVAVARLVLEWVCF